MKTEFTEFQKEAMKIIDLLRLHQEEMEERLSEIFPNVQIKVIAKGVPVYNKGSRFDTFIYKTDHLENQEEYLISSTGANHLNSDWYNDKLFISFIDMSDKGGKDA